MTATEKFTRGLRVFASDIAQGFFEITHNGFALLGLAVMFATITLTARPELREAEHPFQRLSRLVHMRVHGVSGVKVGHALVVTNRDQGFQPVRLMNLHLRYPTGSRLSILRCVPPSARRVAPRSSGRR